MKNLILTVLVTLAGMLFSLAKTNDLNTDPLNKLNSGHEETAVLIIPDTLRAPDEVFIGYLRKNWDDIHDVIMRYHCDDPALKGMVMINMNWVQGKLASAEVSENTTGDTTFGVALISAMKQWDIPGLESGWSSTLPIKTTIKGSDDPDFDQYGILTGKVTDADGQAVPGATIVLHASGNDGKQDITTYTNREGIYILTLIPPGTWQVQCSKQGVETVTTGNITVQKGEHIKKYISM